MDKEQTAIERLKIASEMSLRAYDKPLLICISGGKDSSVIQELALRAGIPVSRHLDDGWTLEVNGGAITGRYSGLSLISKNMTRREDR